MSEFSWRNTPPIDRFNAKYIPEPNSGCWLWVGTVNPSDGYGRFNIKGKPERAHRASWMLHKGPIEAGKCILHRCDVTICVNPGHLFIGTRDDNNKDKMFKGRARSCPGTAHTLAKLDDAAVLVIRSDRRSHAELARVYGVSETTIARVRKFIGWRHVA